MEKSNGNGMKSFCLQYRECHLAKMTGIGELLKFKDHPELLPAPWHPAAFILADKLKKNPDLGIRTVSCKRFGGQCNSRHEQCRALRSQTMLSHLILHEQGTYT